VTIGVTRSAQTVARSPGPVEARAGSCIMIIKLSHCDDRGGFAGPPPNP
jgi:hypothetical protein